MANIVVITITLNITFIINYITIIIIIITSYYFLNNGFYFTGTAVYGVIKFIFERVELKRTKFHSTILNIDNDLEGLEWTG